MRVFAGTDEDSYRWGPRNVVDLDVVVPPQPATQLIADADWKLSGYRSSGRAAIEVNYLLRNAGSEPSLDPIAIAVTCLRDGLVVPDCGAEFAVELSDGFGPTESTWELSVPPGVELRSALRGELQNEAEFQVPARIVGLDRYVWDCYSYRPESGVVACSGWSSQRVLKWPYGEPIKYWVTGNRDYIALFEELVAQSSVWLNLEFVPTQSRESAQFLAIMGVAEAETGGSCPRGSGCASFTADGGAITWAAVEVPYQGEVSDTNARDSVRRDLWTSFMHAASGFETPRGTLDAVLGEQAGTSPLEYELLRLNSHPLVEPDMEMSKVFDLIVFGDQLLEPTPPSDFGIAFEATYAAIEELTRSGSARYSLSNQASGTLLHR